MLRTNISLLACCLAIAAAPADEWTGDSRIEPRTGLWTSYDAGVSYSVSSAAGGGSFSNGSPAPFSVRLIDAKPGRAWSGQLHFPGTLGSGYRPTAASNWAPFRAGFDQSPEEAPPLWQTLLAHHAPPQSFPFVNQSALPVADKALKKHRACARDVDAPINVRDGWPFLVQASREVDHSEGSKQSASYRLKRLWPVEATIPSNPCA